MLKSLRFIGAVCILVLVSSPFISASEIGLNGVGISAGFVSPEGAVGSTFGLGVHADLGEMTEKVRLEAGIDYWAKSYDYGFGWTWKYSSIGISGTAKYFFPVEGLIKPYAGGGLGLQIWSVDYGAYLWKGKVSSSDFGLHFVGGAETELSEKTTGFAQIKYSLAGWDYLSIFAGVTFALGK